MSGIASGELVASPAMEARRTQPWRNPHESDGYLVDYYSVLGVARDASAEMIRDRYRLLMRQYHPDTLEQLGSRCPEEFRVIAKHRSAQYAAAFEVIGDSESRRMYDQALASWSGPVSSNGEPVRALLAPTFNPLVLLRSAEERDREIELYRVHAEQLSGFDPRIHADLEQEIRSNPTCSPMLQRLYGQSLERQAIYLALLQDRVERELGIYNETLGQQPERLLEETSRRLTEVQGTIRHNVQSLLLDVAEGRKQLGGLLGEDIAKELAAERALAVQRLAEATLGEVTRLSSRVHSIAQERETIANSRLQYLSCTYDPAPSSLSGRVILIIAIGDVPEALSLFFELREQGADRVWVGNPVPDGVDAKQLADHQYRTKLAAEGWNLIRVSGEGYPLRALIERVLTLHDEKLAVAPSRTAVD